MIGHLRGTLLELAENIALIDVGGVGYEVEVTSSAAAALAIESGAEQGAEVFTHLVSREDAQALYGFASLAERNLFRALIKVSGIGPKLALSLLSAVSPEQFAACIANGDVAAITSVPGIGKKTAERLVVDLRDRVAALPGGQSGVGGGSVGKGPAADAVLALVALGYRRSGAAQVVGEAAQALGDGADVQALVKEALQRMAAT